MVATGDLGGSVRVWNVAQGERIGGDLPAHTGLGDLVLSPDKKTLVTGGDDGEIKIWDLTRREPLKTFKGHKGMVSGLAMSDDGSHFATASLQDHSVTLWESATGKELRHWPGVEVKSLTFSRDGKHLVTANVNATVYLLECP